MSVTDEDLLADSEGAGAGHNSLAQVTDLVAEWQDLQRELADTMEKVKSLSGLIRNYEMEKIPDAMASANTQKLTTLDGHEVNIKPVVEGSVPKARRAEACTWLRDHGHADIIRQDVTVSFTKGQDTQATELCRELESQGYAPVSEELVHPMTLKSWALERITKGDPDMTDDVMKLLGIFHSRRARIKIAKD